MIDNLLSLLESTPSSLDETKDCHDGLMNGQPHLRFLRTAINAIRPKTILDVGVCDEYIMRSILTAAEKVKYTGCVVKNKDWVCSEKELENLRRKAEGFDVDLIIVDLEEFVANNTTYYDMIYVNIKKSNSLVFDDIQKLISKARYILVGNALDSSLFTQSSIHLIHKYNSFIEYALFLPSLSGDLLIKMKASAKSLFTRDGSSYKSLVDSYNSEYYLNDCGGYETFVNTKGTEITDHRLLAAIYLSLIGDNENVLDIGSGRGELAYALSRLCGHVTGIDYSSDAVSIAQNTYAGINNLRFIKSDILKYEPEKKFDVVIATDVVEHIEQNALLQMFEKVSELLKDDGIFIVHTAPNKLNYKYDYATKRKLAGQIGVYLPKNPRSYYEDEMHINEQSPAGLNRSLKMYFDHVYLWTATPPDMLGNFGSQQIKTTLRSHNSIFVVCSNRLIGTEKIKMALTQDRIKIKPLDIEMSIVDELNQASVCEQLFIEVSIVNNSNETLTSQLPYPVYLSYHWKKMGYNEFEVYDGIRTLLTPPLKKKTNMNYRVSIKTPANAGDYLLELTMLQEGCFWFDDSVSGFPVTMKINVVE